ncbi:hypothetical protein [Methanocaldococcus sp.]|uniref:hypothetical protein n=1 Tax=Methanocaldococcus sp. TaxID=2152917 RepID=UPI0026171704|nr:hypothetical protein [Methanocaldococcus sp.]MCQ6253341.1 hypothetical protein [Methanocaldococcus sp.]
MMDVECKRIEKRELKDKVDVSWYYDGHMKSWVIKIFREDIMRTKIFKFGKKNGEKVLELLKFLLDENDSNDDYD